VQGLTLGKLVKKLTGCSGHPKTMHENLDTPQDANAANVDVNHSKPNELGHVLNA
jgi:hypothetical protein